jgi:glyoxylase-like metal-dependent hydrolase (beta-lactamase superfamily II)
MDRRSIVLAIAALSLTACSPAPTPKRLLADAVAAMGGEEKLKSINTVVMKGGTGSRTRLGQTVHVGDPEMAAQLKDVVETLDLSGRASLDYVLQAGDFMQHRHEVLTSRGDKQVGIEIIPMRPIIATSPGGLFSWGTQNSPEMALRRNAITVMLAALETASDSPGIEDQTFAGKMTKHAHAKSKSGEDVGLYFDPQSKLLVGYEVTDTETMLGDLPAQYMLDDYKAVDGVMLPHHITIRKGDKDYSEIRYSSIAINDSAVEQVFAIPDEASKEADEAIAAGEFSRVALTKVADGLYFARAYSHNSMIVEFPTWLAVVEAPYTEAQTKTLARVVEQQFPGKPIRYAAVTHHHYDHTGGVRGIAALGATVLVEKGHEAALRELLDAKHTNPPDELERRRTAQPAQPTGSIEVYEGKKVISEGRQSLELHPVAGSPHVEPMVLAYVPSARALFQSDLFFPGTGGATSPAAVHLLESVRGLKLRVDTNLGGHGGVGPMAELVKAGTPAGKTTGN